MSQNEPTILIVEDDEHINHIVANVLKKEGIRYTQAFSGTEARIHAASHPYALIILDLMLPGLSGEQFMFFLREELQLTTPVIVLSAKEELDHKLNLFQLGVDDYVTKPFELEELLARIYVHLKRTTHSDVRVRYEHKNMLLDSDGMSVKVNGHELPLTRQEFKIMELLLKHKTRVFTKQDLYELAWGEPYVGEEKTITVHVSNIRSKIKPFDPASYIETVWGVGFRLSPE